MCFQRAHEHIKTTSYLDNDEGDDAHSGEDEARIQYGVVSLEARNHTKDVDQNLQKRNFLNSC